MQNECWHGNSFGFRYRSKQTQHVKSCSKCSILFSIYTLKVHERKKNRKWVNVESPYFQCRMHFGISKERKAAKSIEWKCTLNKIKVLINNQYYRMTSDQSTAVYSCAPVYSGGLGFGWEYVNRDAKTMNSAEQWAIRRTLCIYSFARPRQSVCLNNSYKNNSQGISTRPLSSVTIQKRKK